MTTPYEITSHETFNHDSVDALGFDWERISNPKIAPRRPLQAYFPETTEEVAATVKELVKLQKPYKVRGNAHSSNDLVLSDRGVVICMQQLNKILRFAPDEGYVTVQAGAILSDVDTFLIDRDFGLPIIGDHNHITAGGFASVGGISCASHRYGLFVDNVLALEYVTLTGEVKTLSAGEGAFSQLLTGLGRYGIITSLKCRIVPVKKRTTILHNQLSLFLDFEKFVSAATSLIRAPRDVVMERGMWLSLPLGPVELNLGQFSLYREVKQGFWPTLVDRIGYGYLHALGSVAGRLPEQLDGLVRALGLAGTILIPPYASIKNIERYTDTVLDYTVGDPTRMFVLFSPASEFAALFRALSALCLEFRRTHACFTLISLNIKPIRSAYLAAERADRDYCELMVYATIDPEKMTSALMDQFVSELDNLTITHQAFRYMHTRTSKDPVRRQKIDPNSQYTRDSATAPLAATRV